MTQIQICPVCGKKYPIKDGKKLFICPNSKCENPFLMAHALLENEDENPQLRQQAVSSDLQISANMISFKNLATGESFPFSLPVLLNRNSFLSEHGKPDFAISESEHVCIDFSSAGTYLISDLSRYKATWVNGERLDTASCMLIKKKDILRIGNTELEVE